MAATVRPLGARARARRADRTRRGAVGTAGALDAGPRPRQGVRARRALLRGGGHRSRGTHVPRRAQAAASCRRQPASNAVCTRGAVGARRGACQAVLPGVAGDTHGGPRPTVAARGTRKPRGGEASRGAVVPRGARAAAVGGRQAGQGAEEPRAVMPTQRQNTATCAHGSHIGHGVHAIHAHDQGNAYLTCSYCTPPRLLCTCPRGIGTLQASASYCPGRRRTLHHTVRCSWSSSWPTRCRTVPRGTGCSCWRQQRSTGLQGRARCSWRSRHPLWRPRTPRHSPHTILLRQRSTAPRGTRWHLVSATLTLLCTRNLQCSWRTPERRRKRTGPQGTGRQEEPPWWTRESTRTPDCTRRHTTGNPCRGSHRNDPQSSWCTTPRRWSCTARAGMCLGCQTLTPGGKNTPRCKCRCTLTRPMPQRLQTCPRDKARIS
jgi:hypothetical protein